MIGAELAGPENRSRGIVLTKKGIGESRVQLTRKGAEGFTYHVYVCLAIDRHAYTCGSRVETSTRVIGAELAGPQLVSRGVVLAEEGVQSTLFSLARQNARGYACQVDVSFPVHCQPRCAIICIGAELAGPEHLS